VDKQDDQSAFRNALLMRDTMRVERAPGLGDSLHAIGFDMRKATDVPSAAPSTAPTTPTKAPTGAPSMAHSSDNDVWIYKHYSAHSATVGVVTHVPPPAHAAAAELPAAALPAAALPAEGQRQP
jgi:hypothetical protein